MNNPTVFEKDPAALTALHFGLSPEAAEQHRAGQLSRAYRDYRIDGRLYRAINRVAALDQYDDETGVRVGLDDVVEVL